MKDSTEIVTRGGGAGAFEGRARFVPTGHKRVAACPPVGGVERARTANSERLGALKANVFPTPFDGLGILWLY